VLVERGSEDDRRARCGKTARRDLCGGRRATGGSTVTVRLKIGGEVVAEEG